MKYLVEQYWTQFVEHTDRGTRFRGHLFENLVRDLLREHFGDQWLATSQTWDGGKDFVDRTIRNDISWAECKMYRAPLSLHVISNTLVMAVVTDDVRRILFFSYSRLIDNAKNHLARFGANTSKLIQVFDDGLLEQLILETPKVLREYFPEYIVTNVVEQSDVPLISSFFSSDIHIGYQQILPIEGHDKKRQPSIPLNTPCMFEVMIQSRATSAQLQLQVDWSGFEQDKVGLLNRMTLRKLGSIELQAGQLLSIPIYFAPCEPGILQIPPVKMVIGNLSNTLLPGLEVAVSALVRPSLVGHQIIESLRKFEEVISGGNANRLFSVSGQSGVGKSRYLEEATTRLLRHNYEIHFFDGSGQENKSFSGYIRGLLCSLWRLPSPSVLGMDRNATFNSSVAKRSDEYNLIHQAIYEWSDNDLARRIGELEGTIAAGICNHRAALIVDNVQALPENAVNLLSAIYRRIVARPGQSIILVAFNEDDLVFNDAATGLLNELNHPGKSSIGRTVFLTRLPEFNEEQSRLFLDNLFSWSATKQTFSNTYPQLTCRILDSVMPRPLDLFQLIKGMEDREAIRAVGEWFVICDFDSFESELQSLNKDRERLIRWRVQLLKSLPDVETVIAALTYFGPLTWGDMDDLHIAEDSYKKLVQASVLRWEMTGRIGFYHPSLEKYFAGNIGKDDLISRPIKQFIFQQIQKGDALQNRLSERFALAYDLGETDSEALAATAHLFSHESEFHTMQSRLAGERILRLIEKISSIPSVYPLLSAVDKAAHAASLGQTASLKVRADYLRTISKKIVNYPPGNEIYILDWLRVIRQAGGYMDAITGGSKDADMLVSNALDSLSKTPATIVNCQLISRAKIDLMNRRCVFLKNLGRRDESIKFGMTALDLSSHTDFPDLECLCLIDLGYVEYGLRSRNSRLVDYWSQASGVFERKKEQIIDLLPELEFAVDLVAGSVLAINGNNDVAINKFDNLIFRCREQGEIYYLIQAMLSKGVALIRQAWITDERCPMLAENALQVGIAVEDLAGSAGLQKRYRSAIYLQGKVYETLGKNATALSHYRRAELVKVRDGWNIETESLKSDIYRLDKGKFDKCSEGKTTFSLNGKELPLP